MNFAPTLYLCNYCTIQYLVVVVNEIGMCTRYIFYILVGIYDERYYVYAFSTCSLYVMNQNKLLYLSTCSQFLRMSIKTHRIHHTLQFIIINYYVYYYFLISVITIVSSAMSALLSKENPTLSTISIVSLSNNIIRTSMPLFCSADKE